MKILHPVLLLALVLTSARAEENRYDLLGRTLMPFLNVFAKSTTNPNRAMSFTLKLEQMTDLPPELAGSRVEVAVEYPDKLRLHGPVLGEDVTICRKGQELWAFPGSKVEALLSAAAAAKKLPKADPKFQLQPFALPIPEKELVFLPALFQVKDVGAGTARGRDVPRHRFVPHARIGALTEGPGLGGTGVGEWQRQTRAHLRGQARLDDRGALRAPRICAQAPGEHLGADQRPGRGRPQARSPPATSSCSGRW